MWTLSCTSLTFKGLYTFSKRSSQNSNFIDRRKLAYTIDIPFSQVQKSDKHLQHVPENESSFLTNSSPSASKEESNVTPVPDIFFFHLKIFVDHSYYSQQ
ncbi:hypothetical protein TNCT_566331 [Trichonephila clavata]|uniref:Uncharacterized protein n=1 Tax=Trichonephila clavata TaxID=2740835 RepID=A0A8X6LS05_TRICU|nr:hypothetical protein TNCT_566331 [Trichonephila clavata]